MIWALLGCGIGLSPFSVGGDSGESEARFVPPNGSDAGIGSTDDEPDGDSVVDQDGDGYTIDDCNDADPTIHPGQVDGCDGRDNDCDGETDEDALWDEDPMNAPVDLGLVSPSEEWAVTGLMAPTYDVDAFDFEVEDGLFGWFYIDALTTEMAEDIDIKLTLYLLEDARGVAQGAVSVMDEAGAGELEFLGYSGLGFVDDGGLYRLEVSAMSGSNCQVPYTVVLNVGS